MFRKRSAILFLCLALLAGCETVRQADNLYAEGHYADAAEQYRDFIRQNPNSRWLPNAYIGVAWSEYQQGRYIEAEEAITTLRTRFPDSRFESTARYIHGLTLFAQNRFVEASNELRDIVLEYPDDPIAQDARFLLARSEASLLRYAAAAEDYAKYLEKYGNGPYAAAALTGRARALARIARWREAAEVLNDFIKRFPFHADRPSAMIELARYHSAYGEYTQAESLLKRFRSEYTIPELERAALEQLAEIYDLTGRPAEMIGIRSRLYDILPFDADTRAVIALRLAEHFAQSGDTEKAAAYFTRIRDHHAKDSPAHARALEWLAAFERGRGNREAALMLADEFIRLYPGARAAGDLERLVADILVEAGRIREGRDRLVSLLRKNFSFAEPAEFYRVAALDVSLREYGTALEWAAEGLGRARRAGDTGAMLSGLYHSMIINNLDENLPAVVKHWWELKAISPNYLTVSERVFWDEQEEKMYRDNRAPLDIRAPRSLDSPYQIAVHIRGFDRPEDDTRAVGLSTSLMTLFAASLPVHPDMKYVPKSDAHFVDELVRMEDYTHLPDKYFPLRSTIGADWIVFGSVATDRRVSGNVVLHLKLLRVDYDGIFPFEYLYRLTPEDSITAGPAIVRETIDRLRLYRPDR